MSNDIISVGAAIASAFFGGGSFLVYIFQNKNMSSQTLCNTLNSFLSLEENISNMRIRYKEALYEFDNKPIIYKLKHNKIFSKLRRNKLDIYELKLNEAKAMYINALERLCSCIDKGFFKDYDLREDYRELISDLIEVFPKDFEEGKSCYKSIIKINKKWNNL